MASTRSKPKARSTVGRWLLTGAAFATLAFVGFLLVAVTGVASGSRGAAGAAAGGAEVGSEPGAAPVGWQRVQDQLAKVHERAEQPDVIDAQKWDWLEQDMSRLLRRTDRDSRRRLSPEAFRDAFVGKTADYLKLKGEDRERFERGVNRALEEMEQARAELEEKRASAKGDVQNDVEAAKVYRAAQEEFSAEQREALQHVVDSLDDRPRSHLFRVQALKWFLSLDYGIRAAAR